jgi:hypothetical protein
MTRVANDLPAWCQGASWCPVSITRDGKAHEGNYATGDASIVVVYRGRHVLTWIAPTTALRILALVLLDELVRCPP